LTTNPFSASSDDSLDDKFHEECGVFGVYGSDDSAALTALGLHALQHRGQEAAGIVSFDGSRFYPHRALGLVGEIFGEKEVIDTMPGNSAIGHVRYSTTGETALRNVQPLYADYSFGGLALAHNGNLTNAASLRHDLVERGSLFQSTSDTEVFQHLIATSRGSRLLERVVETLRTVEGAYSLVALSRRKLIGARDPLGVRPLVLGKFGDALIITSETCALDIIGADFVRDVEPGEIIVIDEDGLHSHKPFPPMRQRSCIFEYIYFARPDSNVDGRNVYNARKAIGSELARESMIEADIVIPVPDSGVPAAIGFAQESNLPFELGLIRNHYVGRTFIEPTDEIRHLGVKLKHNANRQQLFGKRVMPRKCICGFPARRPCTPVSTASTRRNAANFWRPVLTSRVFASRSTPTPWPSSAPTVFTAPWARRRATTMRRNSAMPALPANIPFPSPTSTKAARRRKCRCSPGSLKTPAAPHVGTRTPA
jgi:amidophosphoribosyltransferase